MAEATQLSHIECDGIPNCPHNPGTRIQAVSLHTACCHGALLDSCGLLFTGMNSCANDERHTWLYECGIGITV